MVHRLGVRDPREVGGGHLSKPLAEVILGDVLLEKREVLVAVLQHVRQTVLQVRFRAVHVVVEIREGELGLHHPKLGEVARRVRVLRAKRGAKRVHVAHRARVNLRVELPGDGQVRGLTEEILRVVHRAGGVAGDVSAKPRRGVLEGLRLRLAREKLGDGGVNLLLRRVASLLRLLQRLDDSALFRGGRLGLGDVLLGRLRRRGGGGAVGAVEQRRHLELFPGALAVGRGDDRGVDVLEPVRLEEGVRGIRELVANAGDRADGVGAGPEVRDAAEEFERVALLLQGGCGRVRPPRRRRRSPSPPPLAYRRGTRRRCPRS